MEAIDWVVSIGVLVLVGLILVVYRIGYVRGWNAHSRLVWKRDGERIKELRSRDRTMHLMYGYQPVGPELDVLDPPQGGTAAVPNRNIKPPKYDVVTEGYDPDKVKENT
jgi:hypothetical protein